MIMVKKFLGCASLESFGKVFGWINLICWTIVSIVAFFVAHSFLFALVDLGKQILNLVFNFD